MHSPLALFIKYQIFRNSSLPGTFYFLSQRGPSYHVDTVRREREYWPRYVTEGPCPATPPAWCPGSTIPLVTRYTRQDRPLPSDPPAPVRATAATATASGWSQTWGRGAPGSLWRYSSCSSPFSWCQLSYIQQVRSKSWWRFSQMWLVIHHSQLHQLIWDPTLSRREE